MARAALIAQDAGSYLVDINMGCPAKRVTGGYGGAALMCDLDLAQSLIAAVVRAVRIRSPSKCVSVGMKPATTRPNWRGAPKGRARK